MLPPVSVLSLLDLCNSLIDGRRRQCLGCDFPLRPPCRRRIHETEIFASESQIARVADWSVGINRTSLIDEVVDRAPVA